MIICIITPPASTLLKLLAMRSFHSSFVLNTCDCCTNRCLIRDGDVSAGMLLPGEPGDAIFDGLHPFAHAIVPRNAALEEVAAQSTRIFISESEIVNGCTFCGWIFAACMNTDSLCNGR